MYGNGAASLCVLCRFSVVADVMCVLMVGVRKAPFYSRERASVDVCRHFKVRKMVSFE